MAKSIKQHYEEEFEIVNERLHHYTDWGYSPELEPLVTALYNAWVAIKEQMSKL